MIIALFSLLIGYSYYSYIYIPMKDNISKLEDKVAHAEKTVTDYRLKAIPQNKLYDDYEYVLKHTSSISNQYYKEILQEEIILNIKGLIEGAGIEVSSLNFSSPTYTIVTSRSESNGVTSLLEDLALSFTNTRIEESKTTSINPGQNEQVKYMSITLSFTGNYNNIKNFISQINNNRYRLIINNIALNSTEETGMFVASAAIDVYSIPYIITDETKV